MKLYRVLLCRLPEKLPNNVKFIISTLPDVHGILKSAQSLGLPEDNFVKVRPLDEASAWNIVDKWLEMSKRKVTPTSNCNKAYVFEFLGDLKILCFFFCICVKNVI